MPDDIADTISERERTHGSYECVSETAQLIKRTWGHARSVMSCDHVEALDCIATKIARIICGDASHEDHWRDI